MNFKYITDFHKSRAGKIGSSDIPSLIPHPVKQIESLNAWTDSDGKRHLKSAIDLYNEKISPKVFTSGFSAEMGHRLEGYALYEFIKDNIDEQIAKDFLRGYQLHELETRYNNGECVNPEPYNNTPFKHNTEVETDWGIAHADCLYIPIYEKTGIIEKNGFKIDMSKPFIIEAKTATSHSAKRKDDIFKGYDFALKSWQGIPLKHYFQIQYQLALYDVDIAYLTLIYDTSNKAYFEIKANKKHQKEIMHLAKLMKKAIDTKTPPKELAINSKDIASLYPEIKDDFRDVQGEELDAIIDIIKDEIEAKKQVKIWKQKEIEATERISIHLKDTETLKGKVNGVSMTLAKWKKTGGSNRIIGLTEIKKRDDKDKIINYLEKNDLIKKTAENKKPSIMVKNIEE